MQTLYPETRRNPETSNCGNRWSKTEEENLLEEIKTMSIEDIGLSHKRTVGGIKARLLLLSCNMLNEGLSMDEVIKKTTMNEDDIEDYHANQENKKEKRMEKRKAKKEAKRNEKLLMLNSVSNSAKSSEVEPFAQNLNDKNQDKYINILIEIRDLLQIIADKEVVLSMK